MTERIYTIEDMKEINELSKTKDTSSLWYGWDNPMLKFGGRIEKVYDEDYIWLSGGTGSFSTAITPEQQEEYKDKIGSFVDCDYVIRDGRTYAVITNIADNDCNESLERSKRWTTAFIQQNK